MMFLSKVSYPKKRSGSEWIFVFLFSLSLAFFILAKVLPMGSISQQKEQMFRAAQILSEAEEALRTCLSERGLAVVEEDDINDTGLIGLEWSEMTTSVGNLEAKRTTTNPNMAALVVFLLHKAGVEKGDAVAVGGSGSFPALILAVLSAAKAMDLEPLLICSLGASQWGANRLEFHFLDMLECLWSAGIFHVRPAAASLGGERDIAEAIPQDVRHQLISDIEDSGISFIHEPELRANVQKRMLIYEKQAGEKEIACFVNIGGNWSNMGIDSEILNVKPGLAKIRKIPPIEKRGLLFEMAVREIPVVHLLFIKGLVDSYGLPWDPSPLPQPGSGPIYDKPVEDRPLFLLLGVVYLLVLALFFFVSFLLRKRRKPKSA